MAQLGVYDKGLLSTEDQAKMLSYKNGYEMATTDADRTAYNTLANQLRAKYNYSLGDDGATYTPLATVTNNAGVISNPTQAGVAQIDTSAYLAGAQAQATKQKTTAREDYIKNLTNLASTYNQNRTDLLNSAADSKNEYTKTMSDAYQAAYTNNEIAKQNAVANGLQSTGLGNAMQVAALASANRDIGQIASDRNTALTSIANQLDTLSANYNTSRDALLQNLYNQELAADADAYTNYFNNLLSADTTNANAYNEYILNALGYDATAIENAKQRAQEAANLSAQYQYALSELGLTQQYEAEQKALDRASQKELMSLAASLGLTSY